MAASVLASCTGTVNEAKPQRRDILEWVFASGTLQAETQYNLTAQTEGYLVAVNFKEGDIVGKNEVLAIVGNDENLINAQGAEELHQMATQNTRTSSPALQEMEAKIDAATAKLEQDTRQSERFARLHQSNSISTAEYEGAQLTLANSRSNLTALKKQYEQLRFSARQSEMAQRYAARVSLMLSGQNKLAAPAAGKVYIRNKQLGDYVSKGDIIATIGSPEVYARLNVDESGMPKLKVGQEVVLRVGADKDIVYDATIAQISPAFDEVSRSFIVKAHFNHAPTFHIMGSQLEANIFIGEIKAALVIPSDYLRYGNKVWLKDEQRLATIKPGIINNGWVQILSGLQAGQTIVKEDP